MRPSKPHILALAAVMIGSGALAEEPRVPPVDRYRSGLHEAFLKGEPVKEVRAPVVPMGQRPRVNALKQAAVKAAAVQKGPKGGEDSFAFEKRIRGVSKSLGLPDAEPAVQFYLGRFNLLRDAEGRPVDVAEDPKKKPEHDAEFVREILSQDRISRDKKIAAMNGKLPGQLRNGGAMPEGSGQPPGPGPGGKKTPVDYAALNQTSAGHAFADGVAYSDVGAPKTGGVKKQAQGSNPKQKPGKGFFERNAETSADMGYEHFRKAESCEGWFCKAYHHGAAGLYAIGTGINKLAAGDEETWKNAGKGALAGPAVGVVVAGAPVVAGVATGSTAVGAGSLTLAKTLGGFGLTALTVTGGAESAGNVVRDPTLVTAGIATMDFAGDKVMRPLKFVGNYGRKAVDFFSGLKNSDGAAGRLLASVDDGTAGADDAFELYKKEMKGTTVSGSQVQGRGVASEKIVDDMPVQQGPTCAPNTLAFCKTVLTQSPASDDTVKAALDARDQVIKDINPEALEKLQGQARDRMEAKMLRGQSDGSFMILDTDDIREVQQHMSTPGKITPHIAREMGMKTKVLSNLDEAITTVSANGNPVYLGIKGADRTDGRVVNHAIALLKTDGDRLLIRDPSKGTLSWVSKATIEKLGIVRAFELSL
jgi:hypothetical protein